MRAWTMSALASLVALAVPALACGPRLQLASLGDFPLRSGDTIRDAVVGYRTLGRLNAARSNAVLVTPWYQGTSGQLARQIGPGKLVDSSAYFVIVVDAFGNGVSSSPSNSRAQAGPAFPAFSIADVVASHHRLVTETFGLTRLHAVIGVSMGGMQALQWATAYPGFAARIVSIVGSPQAQPDDIARWDEGIRWWGGSTGTRVRAMLADWKPRSAFNEWRLDAFDQIRQAQAIQGNDIARDFGGSMTRAIEAIRSEVMIATTWEDREVNPRPAFDFARAAGAELLELDGRCGHQAPSCDRARLWAAVARFLAR